MNRMDRAPSRRRPRRLAAAAAAVAALLAAAWTTAGPGAADRPGTPPGGADATTGTATPTSATAAAAPRHLQGRPPAGPTGLRLLVASDPPRLVDVDRGTSRPVGGLPAGQEPVSVAPVGDGAILTSDQQVFVLGRGAGRAAPVGRASSAVASLDGRGVWLLEQGPRCRLREVALDGRDRRPGRLVPCTVGLLAETRLGLLVWTEPTRDGDQAALLDPGTGRVEARWPEVHGVVGDLVLWGGQEPDADPSWSRAQGQVSDIWLLNLDTRRWRRLPGMPLITALKFMSMAWTGDGRLVLAGDFDQFGRAVATWRPGQDHLAVKRLALPAFAGSDTFVPWPAPAA
jgi:hypothetical protein